MAWAKTAVKTGPLARKEQTAITTSFAGCDGGLPLGDNTAFRTRPKPRADLPCHELAIWPDAGANEGESSRALQ